MKLDPETREKAAQAARSANYKGGAIWDDLSESAREGWRMIVDAVAATIPEPVEDERVRAWDAIASHPFFRSCYGTGSLLATMLDYLDGRCQPTTIPEPTPADGPRPIDPADVRVGDRVRVGVPIYTDGTVERVAFDGLFMRDDSGCPRFCPWGRGGLSVEMLDRPDPDADLIRTLEGIDQSLHGAALGTWGRGFLDALAAAGLAIEPVPTVGDLHA